MSKTHVFRFVDADLNRKLIALLNKEAKSKFSIDEKQFIRYAHIHEDLIGNHLICKIRDSVFAPWQVIAFPKSWRESYARYMAKNKVPHQEELRDGVARFLIPRKYRPHSWKLADPEISKQVEAR